MSKEEREDHVAVPRFPRLTGKILRQSQNCGHAAVVIEGTGKSSIIMSKNYDDLVCTPVARQFSDYISLVIHLIRQIEHQAEISKENIDLFRENIELNQERFIEGQISAYDLLTDEIDLQKETAGYNARRAGLVARQIELLNNSGIITAFIEKLRK